MRTVKHGCLARRLIPRLRCAAPAISSESASEAASWIGCSAAAANGVHGPCLWYGASRLAPRTSWSSRCAMCVSQPVSPRGLLPHRDETRPGVTATPGSGFTVWLTHMGESP